MRPSRETTDMLPGMSIRRSAALAAAFLLGAILVLRVGQHLRPRHYLSSVPAARGVVYESGGSVIAGRRLRADTPREKLLGSYVCQEWTEVPESGLLPAVRRHTWWEIELAPVGSATDRHTDRDLLAAAAAHINTTSPEIRLDQAPDPEAIAGERYSLLPAGILSLVAMILWIPLAGMGGWLAHRTGRRYVRRWLMRCRVCSALRRGDAGPLCPDCKEPWIEAGPKPGLKPEPPMSQKQLAMDETWDEDPEDLQPRQTSKPPQRPGPPQRPR